MRDISRRRFLKASVAGVGLAGVGCGAGTDGTPGQGGTVPPAGNSPDPMPPPSGGGQPPMGGQPPTGGQSPTGGQPPGNQPPQTTPTQPPPGSEPNNPPPTNPTTPQPPVEQPKGPMLMRPLGNTGLMISAVGFGGGSRYLMAGEAEAERMIHRAIELGITYFDTAFSYGSNQASQKRFGKYLVPMYRSRITLVSKIDDRTAAGAKRQLDLTLQALGTDKLDIVHFHAIGSKADVDRIVGPGGALETLRQAKQQGIVRFIGVSGHSTGAILLDALQRIKPDVVMCPQNAAKEAGFTDTVLSHGRQNGIGLLGMKVTAQDALMRNGVTAPQLLRYSLSLPVSAMIVGMRSMAVLESCCAIGRAFTAMPEAEMAQLNAKYAALDMGRCLPYRRRGYRDGHCFA
jgi:aryl-alcohol dehydrogenase-like predicted oxidoreductase